MTVFTKIRWIAGILLVFFIVLVTNLIDRDNFNQLSYSVTTMYEDRIVANDLIFEMSRLIQEKEIATVTKDTAFFQERNDAVNRELGSFMERYQQTKLTDKEAQVFRQLQEELQTLEREEQEYGTWQTADVQKSLDRVDQHLYDLSKIQLQEGRQQVFISDKAKNAINLFTQAEIIFLILMAILVQLIILYKPKELQEK